MKNDLPIGRPLFYKQMARNFDFTVTTYETCHKTVALFWQMYYNKFQHS